MVFLKRLKKHLHFNGNIIAKNLLGEELENEIFALGAIYAVITLDFSLTET